MIFSVLAVILFVLVLCCAFIAFRQLNRKNSEKADAIIRNKLSSMSSREAESVRVMEELPNAVLVCSEFGVAFGKRVILDGVNFSISKTGITVLMGPTGTGKSTLLRSLAGMFAKNTLYSSWGSITYQNKELTEEDSLSLVSQQPKHILRSVFEGILFNRPEQYRSLNKGEQRKQLVVWLDQLGASAIAAQLDAPLIDLSTGRKRMVAILREAVMGSPLLMIDEPTSGMTDDDAKEVLSLLKSLSKTRALFVVLHNQKQAREIASKVILLAGGCVQATATAEKFFDTPPNPVAEQFVRTGSCAVPRPGADANELDEECMFAPKPLSLQALNAIEAYEPPPEETAVQEEVILAATDVSEEKPAPSGAQAQSVCPFAASAQPSILLNHASHMSGPRGFTWIVQDTLAACPRPGVCGDIDYDLVLLQRAGITTVISLTEEPLPQDALERHGLKSVHLPIVDGKVTSLANVDKLVVQMQEMIKNGQILVVHCLAGYGRTGTIIGAFMMREFNLSASSVLKKLRTINHEFVQTEVQERFLSEYEHFHDTVK